LRLGRPQDRNAANSCRPQERLIANNNEFAMAGNFACNDNGVRPTITASNNEHQCKNNGRYANRSPRGRPAGALTAGARELRPSSGHPIITIKQKPGAGFRRARSAQFMSFNFPNSLICAAASSAS
jgi:hypothetical protein